MSVRRLIALATLAVAALAPAPAHAGTPTGNGSGGFTVTEVGTFERPIDLGNAPGRPNALFVAEQQGRVLVRKGGVTRTFLDITGLVEFAGEGEEGLLSITFHPGYARNGLVYLYYTNGGGDNVVVEYRRKRGSPLEANPASARLVLKVSHPFAGNHNGGELQFGPDRLLYLSTGDGGGGGDQFEQAQNLNSLLGKLLRFDPRRVKRCPGQRARRAAKRRGLRCGGAPRSFTPARTNPFAGSTPGLAAIYAVGLRNPFRFSFDSGTGAIAIGDVGQACLEEIDYRRRGRARGANFGWARFEGSVLFNNSRSAPGAIGPIHQYNNPAMSLPAGICPDVVGDFEGQSVIGGVVVRDSRIGEQFGRLLYGDASDSSGQIRSLIPSEGGASDDQDTGVHLPAGTPFSFAEGAGNRIYVAGGRGDVVYRLDPS